jgi:2'-5' RNA ligase
MSARLFVALDLPEEVRAAIPAPPDPPWRRVPAENLHVTLAFLGSRDEEEIPRVAVALEGAVTPVGTLTLGEVIALPERRPRVLAVRLDDPSGACRDCQASVSAALAAAGLYEPESRPWLPHVTIGRARGAVARGGTELEVPPLSFTPPSVTLYRSRPGRGGAAYESLARFAA